MESGYDQPSAAEEMTAAQKKTLEEMKLKDLKVKNMFQSLDRTILKTLSVYFSRVMMVANDMKNLGEDIPDVKIVEKILRTLTEKWNYIVCSIEESKDIDKLSVDALQSSLFVHEHKFIKDKGEEQALVVSIRGRFGGFRGDRGRGCYVFNKATIECYNCHILDHYQYECPVLKKQANYVEVEELEEMLLMAYIKDAPEEDKKKQKYFH